MASVAITSSQSAFPFIIDIPGCSSSDEFENFGAERALTKIAFFLAQGGEITPDQIYKLEIAAVEETGRFFAYMPDGRDKKQLSTYIDDFHAASFSHPKLIDFIYPYTANAQVVRKVYDTAAPKNAFYFRITQDPLYGDHKGWSKPFVLMIDRSQPKPFTLIDFNGGNSRIFHTASLDDVVATIDSWSPANRILEAHYLSISKGTYF